jgi:hypothetical protein
LFVPGAATDPLRESAFADGSSSAECAAAALAVAIARLINFAKSG